ncbi:MAG: hypothetical protein HC881_19770, partial [Leptolyngbyaceae cyanobacterium SL_7_1]|nr:hypothetical protein [Leptolyngbyaceae cyanobacterium SL_7_1]
MSDRYEENDVLLTAFNLGTLSGVGAIANLSIDDDDWFQLTTTAPGTAESLIQLDFRHAEGDIDVVLVDANSTILRSSTGTTDGESLSLEGLAAGTYFLRAYGYDAANNSNYTLRFNLPGNNSDDPYENNDSRNSAANLQTITTTTLLSGLTARDHDWFRFTTIAPGTTGSSVRIDFLHDNGDLDLRLVNVSGRVIDSSASIDDGEEISLAGLAAGTYYIRVSGAAGAVNAYYDLTITPPGDRADAYEDNDTATSPSVLGTLTNPFSLAGLSITDADWFQFTTTNPGTAESFVRADFLQAEGDIDLQLLDVNGTVIGTAEGNGDRHQISLNGLAAGTYLVHLYGYNNATNPNYTLSITPPTARFEDAYEDNDTQAAVVDPFAAAHLGALAYPFTLETLSLTDEDWFQFRTIAPGTSDSAVQIDFLHVNGDIDMQLVDASGRVIAASESANDSERLSLSGLAAGDYYVRIYGFNGASNPSYRLTVTPPLDPASLAPDRFEPNDSQATATDLNTLSGTTQFNNLTIHQSNNEDWFQFTLAVNTSAQHDAKIEFNHQLGDLDLQLYNQDGILLNGSYGRGNTESLSLDGLIAGTYFLRAYGYGGATHPNYSLTIDAPEISPVAIPEDAAEQNDSLDQAYSLRYDGGYYSSSALNLSIDNSPNEASRQDWFRFTLPTDGVVGNRVAIEFDHSLGDLDLGLFDNNGTLITGSQGTSNQEAISLEGLAAGTYYLHVYGYQEATNPNYLLTIDGPTPNSLLQPDSLEANNSLATATELRDISGTGNVWQNLTISSAEDQDWFKFTTTATATGNDFVQINFNHAAGDLALALFDSNGTLLTQSNGSTDNELVSLQGLAAGTYYAQVVGVNAATNPNYTLSIDAPQLEATQAEWTILVYLAADNDLESFGIEDLNEMEVPILPNTVRVVTLVDRLPGYDNSNGNWTDTRRGRITHDTNPNMVSSPLTSLGELNMGAPQTLTDFIQWGVQTNPAENYGLVLWNHGGGLSGLTWDDTNNSDNLTLREITTAIQASGVDFDLIGFDACLQAMVEQGYELKNLTDVMVASQKTEPGDGWDYTAWLSQLAADPTMGAEALGAAIVSTYGEFYGDNETLSVTRVGDYDELKTAIDIFATTALVSGTDADWQTIAAARDATPYFSLPEYRDLKTFTDTIATNPGVTDPIRTAAAAVSTAITNALVRNHSGNGEGGRGLSIYLPEFGNAAYTQEFTSLYSDTNWLNFLNRNLIGLQRVVAASPDWAEVNDVRSQATNLHRLAGANKLFTGLNIGTASDVDWFRFETVATGSNTDSVQIAFDSTAGELTLQLYDTTGTLLQTSTNSNSGATSIEKVSLDSLTAGQISFLKIRWGKW